MTIPKDLAAGDRVTHMMLAAVLKKLEILEARFDEKIAHLPVDLAVGAFREYLNEYTRRPENYDFLLSCFLYDFSERNMSDITAEEIEAFLKRRWGGKISTFKQRLAQLKGLFNCANEIQQKRKAPTFHNPCELVKTGRAIVKEPEFIPTKTMKRYLESISSRSWWTINAIVATGGLRVSEVLKLTPNDISDRVLTIRDPKSGRSKEMAVVPKPVAIELKLLSRNISEFQKIFEMSRQIVGREVKRYGAHMDLDLSPHKLRKWCASYWQRKGEEGMVAFVLRHSCSSLRGRYISPSAPAEAIYLQDQYICLDIFR